MIEIRVDGKTPTINHMYGFKGYRKFIKPEGRRVREAILKNIIKAEINTEPYIDKNLILTVEIYENWLTKRNKCARKDIANREKFLIDSVFKALKLDDKQIWKHTMAKVQSQEEYSIIKIKLLHTKFKF